MTASKTRPQPYPTGADTGASPAGRVDPVSQSDVTAVKTVSLQEARLLCDAPPPFPFGWFAVALCHELRAGAVLTRQFMDREIVVYRTESGTACAVEAYCPHLGAHLGHGGEVCGEELRCPFHGFRFSVKGSCVYSPSGAPPPAARLGLLEVREIHGAVFVWHGPAGQVPWEIDAPDDESEWRKVGHTVRHVHSHPQELAENNIDIMHFGALHGFRNFQLVKPPIFDGPRMRLDYTYTQLTPWNSGVDVEIRFRIDGFGVVVNEADLFGFSLRFFALWTPVGERDTIQYLLVSVRKRGRSPVGKAFWCGVEKMSGPFILRGLVDQIKQDESVWTNKKYLRRPAIAEGDGPIHAYRRWASQFYPEGAAW
ncbi:Rieske 2Fe-2S domain-containing protein [Mycobacterium sp. Aquia_213]|uniref:Rieske 2Fe-2S domain-containing protein n=1 Tax=Mycobacterium sp. Aquia_213 TaxID=2991728 RepID=UPI0022712EBA|nr:Rieske 2Fe-2S domain-containing protein [Mycobacterium sp. Aquia_213]WAC92462.1 Rieske 2Fe-2S domain-containing protein [Mycobacterium sp. Aquia_213]